MKPADIDEFFRRLAADNPAPKTELEYINPYTLLVAVVLSAQATDVGVNKATEPAVQDRQDAGSRCWRWGRRGCSELHQDDRPVQHQGEERHRAVGDPGRRARRRGAAHARGAGGPARRRPQDRQRRAQRRVRRDRPSRSTRTSSASPTAPAWRRGKTPREVERKLLKRRARARYRLHAHHWLILHGRYICKARKPRMPGLRRARPLRLPGQDQRARHAGRSAGAGQRRLNPTGGSILRPRQKCVDKIHPISDVLRVAFG